MRLCTKRKKVKPSLNNVKPTPGSTYKYLGTIWLVLEDRAAPDPDNLAKYKHVITPLVPEDPLIHSMGQVYNTPNMDFHNATEKNKWCLGELEE